jgi:hypothetical protein
MKRLAPMKRLALLMVVVWLIAAGVARADVGGEQFAPGQCPYPAVGGFGLDGVGQHYVCDFPTEINGSRHHCVYGGAAAFVGANLNLLIVQFSVLTNAGVLEGVCYWACPDGSVSAEPNPVQTWQGSASSTVPVKRTDCNALAPNPIPPEQPRGVMPQQEPVGGETP